MNNKNTVRANVRSKIYEKYSELFEILILEKPSKRYKTEYAKKVVELFKTKIGYSKSTYDQDIFGSAYRGYIHWKETGKSIYQSHQSVRKYKLKSN